MASCLGYDPSILPTFISVFDGTVTAVDGDEVTFKVNDGWKGVDGQRHADGPAGRRRDSRDRRPRSRSVVAISSRRRARRSAPCGYTLDYAATAAKWAAAFGS